MNGFFAEFPRRLGHSHDQVNGLANHDNDAQPSQLHFSSRIHADPSAFIDWNRSPA